jgi:hypothetical protein
MSLGDTASCLMLFGVRLSYSHVFSVQLLHAWLVHITATYPVVSKSFDVHIKCGQSIRKRLNYSNQYSTRKTFCLSSSSSLMQVTPAQMTLEVRVDICGGDGCCGWMLWL